MSTPSKLFGTMGGVFTPCTLTILGVIMFLRLGYVVGNSGIWLALAIVLVSKLITLLTTISLSGIATNTRVKGGGAYFLISRSLGVEFGGAIGIVFFLAQAISVALYALGFAEAVVGSVPGVQWSIPVVATITNIGVFAIGSNWRRLDHHVAIRNPCRSRRFVDLFFSGATTHFDPQLIRDNWNSQYVENNDVWLMFALFFPAVTGIMAGANMSGDLKDPAKSIPKGTLLAILVTGLIYMALVVILGGTTTRETLVNNKLVMAQIAAVPVLITAGVLAATLSSALGSMMGAPRILQALSRDSVFNSLAFFGKGSGVNQEPRRAVVLTFLISQFCILVGDLNAIAPIITMSFLITYGMLNLATFYEKISRNPSYRPRFRFGHWSLSLLGAVSCLAVMFLLDPWSAVVSILLMWALHQYISQKRIASRWGDLQSGLVFERARSNLLKLEDYLYHPKNWRPIILAFSGQTWTRPHLAIYGHWFTTGHGILSLGQVIIGEVDNRLERRMSQERILHKFIRDEGLEAFPAVVVAQTQSEGIESVVQCHGLGALRPNLVLFNWPTSADDADWFGCTLRTVSNLQRSVVAIRNRDTDLEPWAVPRGTIDVWWRGEQNGALMLLLAHLLISNSTWSGRAIRLIRMINSEAGKEEVMQHLSSLIQKSRIKATPKVVVADDIRETVQSVSAEAAMVILGFEVPPENEEIEFFERMENIAGELPRVTFVKSHGEAELES